MIHFEQLWELAERLTLKYKISPEEQDIRQQRLASKLVMSSEEDWTDANLMGDFLLNLSRISQQKNINAYQALKQSMEDFESENIEKDADKGSGIFPADT